MTLNTAPSKTTGYAWLVAACNGLFLLYKYILQLFPSVMTQDLMQTFHLHGAGLGNLAATYFYSFLIMQLFSGYLLDRFSPRIITTCAILFCALGVGSFAITQTLFMAECARALIGIGVAFATVSYLKQAAIWFPPKQLALVGGLLASAVGLGALIGQAPLAHLVQAWGWRQALIGCSILGLGIAALYFTLVHDKPSMHHTTSTQPTINRQAIMTVLKNRRNWLLAGYSGLAFSPLAVFGGLWGNPFLQSTYHLNTIESAQYITLAFLGLGIGSPVLGWLADRLNRRMDIMITATIISLITLTLLLTSYPFNHTVLRLLLFLFGLGTGGFMLGFTVAKTLNPTMVAATVVAMINTGDALFGAITEPLVGFLLDHHHTGGSLAFSTQDFQYGLVILPGYLIVAVACAIWAKVYTTQNKQGHMSKKYTNRVRYAPS
ncbi:MAG TPA: MFS transporter [Coxiellaceae bacterium]|nr:MFS transporter [Coxiellaceae bacterium]